MILSISRRSALILPAVVALGIALQRGLRRRLWLILAVGILLMAVLYLLLTVTASYWQPIVERWSSLLVFSDAGYKDTGPIHQRLILFKHVVERLRGPTEWLFGLGTGTVGFAVRNYINTGFTADGYYAILLGEYGLIGLLLYSALVLTVLSKLLRPILQRRLGPEQKAIVIACLASSLAVLVGGWAGNTNTTFPHVLFLWAFPGVGLATSAEP